ncbi:hypothetical protein HPB50_022022 [Hyalomma asiaticum]|uniref:Uncharacterized protein n=1 Tax=Hyalomma asiaticum TaxID=266040 RepID=A0ACB7T1C0_HYAAI|nr:hypothetical protein HPB50_022022 [Hyalomma asiaticum]
MQSSGIDVKELRREIDDLKQSMEILNGLVETLRSEKAVLAADNKKLLIENSLLSRKVEEIEQYSRINNVEIKGIPCTQGEDCVTILQKALAGCFWIGAAETFTANGCCQPESPMLLRNGVLGAILDDTLMRRLRHVEYGYSASSSRTVTSPAHPGPADYQALKGTLASASVDTATPP